MAACSRLNTVNIHVYERGGGGFKRISCFDAPGARRTVHVLYRGGTSSVPRSSLDGSTSHVFLRHSLKMQLHALRACLASLGAHPGVHYDALVPQ